MKKTVTVRGRKYWRAAKEFEPRKPAKPKPRRKVKPAPKVGYDVADDGCWTMPKKRKRRK